MSFILAAVEAPATPAGLEVLMTMFTFLVSLVGVVIDAIIAEPVLALMFASTFIGIVIAVYTKFRSASGSN